MIGIVDFISRSKFLEKEHDGNIRKGFSLIEIVIALAIVGAMAGVGFAAFRYFRLVNINQTKSKLTELQGAINTYKLHTNQYPQQLVDLNAKPQGIKRWQGPYVDDAESLEDGWGQSFVYQVSPKGAEHPYELYSQGNPDDAQANTISVWEL